MAFPRPKPNPAQPSPGAPEFKCGWCGALTLAPRKPRPPPWACMRRVNVVIAATIVFVVVSLVAAISVIGVMAVFPLLFDVRAAAAFARGLADLSAWADPSRLPAPPPGLGLLLLHAAVTAALTFHVLFNYAAASLLSAGTARNVPHAWVPPTHAIGPTEACPCEQGAFEEYTFCRLCQYPRPPRAHHCKTCGECVLEMDHHCPFIANCVGLRNTRPFLLFLIWAVLGCFYAFAMCAWAAWRLWPHIVAASTAVARGAPALARRGALGRALAAIARFIAGEATVTGGKPMSGWSAGALFFIWSLIAHGVTSRMPWWGLPLSYIAFAAAVIAAALSGLLASQLWLLVQGDTYLESLAGPGAPPPTPPPVTRDTKRRPARPKALHKQQQKPTWCESLGHLLLLRCGCYGLLPWIVTQLRGRTPATDDDDKGGDEAWVTARVAGARAVREAGSARRAWWRAWCTARGAVRMRAVFGSGSAITWLAPRITPPPGALTAADLMGNSKKA